MVINADLTVRELIKQMEAEIAEKTDLLLTLKKAIGEPLAAANSSIARPSSGVSSEVKKRSVPPANGSADPNYIPVATRAINLLRKLGEPLATGELIEEFKKLNDPDVEKKNFSTALYTALVRREKDVFRERDGKWHLREWAVKDEKD